MGPEQADGRNGGEERAGREKQDHTIHMANFWGVLQKGIGKAVCSGRQRLQGTDKEPFVAIRNSLGKGRHTVPSRGGSCSAFWGSKKVPG